MTERPFPGLDREAVSIPGGHTLARLPGFARNVGVAGLAASLLLIVVSGADQFFFSWLVAFSFFLSIAIGGLFFVIVHYTAKAAWSTVPRRVAEHAMYVLFPHLAILGLPILLGLGQLYHWSHGDAVAHDHLLQAKSGYLNVAFFVIRAVVYFACWWKLSRLFGDASVAQDGSGDHAITRRLQNLAPPALAAFALTTTFAAIDWIMSLEPHWYSTMWGVYYFAGALVSFIAFTIVVLVVLRSAGLLRDVVTLDHFHDLGKMLFGFNVFWTYIAFCQYFLIWYANIPEETVWYLPRLSGGWMPVTLMLVLGHFVIPFFALMPRTVKRTPPLLAAGALWMLAMQVVDLHWVVMPTLHEAAFHPTLLDVTCLLAVGGLFAWSFGERLVRHPLVPLRDPRLAESLRYENV